MLIIAINICMIIQALSPVNSGGSKQDAALIYNPLTLPSDRPFRASA